MNSYSKHLDTALLVACIAAAFLLGLNKIHDPDTWLHLSHGKLIWQTKGMPQIEPFSFVDEGKPYYYPSWLFAVIAYLAHSLSDFYGLVLMKAIVVGTAFGVVYMDSLRPYRQGALAAILLLPALWFASDRFVMRPDIFAMLFIALSIHWLNAYLHEGKRYVYALPLVHWAWANTHLSINLMLGIYGAFIVGGFMQRKLNARGFDAQAPSGRQLKTMLALAAISFGVTLLNPYGIDQYLRPLSVLGDETWNKQNIFELAEPTGWLRTTLFVIAGSVLGSFAILGRRAPIAHLILVLPYLYLPFTAKRFLFLIALVGMPVLVRNLSAFAEARGWKSMCLAQIKIAAIALVVTFIALTQLRIGHFHLNEPGFGFERSELAPYGAVKYMDERNIEGRVFNLSFYHGQYINWTGYPRRTALWDARLYNSQEILRMMESILVNPSLFEEQYEKFGFDALIIEHTKREISNYTLGAEYDFWFDSPRWALVYWDDQCSLYLRRGGRYENVVRQDGYQQIKPNMSATYFMKHLDEMSAEQRGALEAELKRNIALLNSDTAWMFLGLMQAKAGDFHSAHDSFAKVQETFSSDLSDYVFKATSGYASYKLGKYDEAMNYLLAAMQLREDTRIVYMTADCMIRLGKFAEAVPLLEEISRRQDATPSTRQLLETAKSGARR